jgi:hypothetical protein
VIKENDRYIKFVFFTGVSKFSRASIFSRLNMLEDISLSPRFGNIIGVEFDSVKRNVVGYEWERV